MHLKFCYRTILSLVALALLLSSCTDTDRLPKREKKIIPIKSVKDVLANLSKLPQDFEIDPTVEQVLKGEQGTVLYIPTDAFQFEDGSTPKGMVNIELRECYRYSDMIAENQHTLSAGRILETGGMIYVNATADGEQLRLKKGKAYVAAFPKPKAGKDMELFYGIPFSDSSTTWLNTIDRVTMSPKENMDDLLTDDLMDYFFWYGKFNVALNKYKLQGQNRTIMEYLNDSTVVPRSVKRNFRRNDWRVYLSMKIDQKGQLYEIRKDVEDGDPSSGTLEAYQTIIDILKKAPRLDLGTDGPLLRADWKYSLGISADQRIDRERLKVKMMKRYQYYQDRAVAKIDQAELNYYIFAVTEMGWINCDRFVDTDEKKIDFKVVVPNPREAKVVMVFKDMRSIMNASLEGDALMFKNVPLNRKVRLIAISYINGKPTIASLDTIIMDKPPTLSRFKEFSFNELESELNK